MGNSPAFQFYPADLMSDPEVMFWDMEQLGCYWQVITYLWLNSGLMASNPEVIRKLFRVKRRDKAELMWRKIKVKFDISDGIVTHKRVLEEMQKQADARLRKQEAGRRGAEARWQGHVPAIPPANVLPLAEGMAENGSSSSSSSSVNTDKRIQSAPNRTITFDFDAVRFVGITDIELARWKIAYPAVDVPGVILQAAEWMGRNPAKRKKNYGLFLVKWLAREQEKGGSAPSAGLGQPTKAEIDAERKKQRETMARLDEQDKLRAEAAKAF